MDLIVFAHVDLVRGAGYERDQVRVIHHHPVTFLDNRCVLVGDISLTHLLVGDIIVTHVLLVGKIITVTHVLLGDIVRIALDLCLACSFTMFKLGAIITVSYAEVGCLADLFSQVAGSSQVSADQFWISFLKSNNFRRPVLNSELILFSPITICRLGVIIAVSYAEVVDCAEVWSQVAGSP